MNRHFEDARYYLGRAAETATKGVKRELEGVEERFREVTGREQEPEPGRLDKIRGEVKDLEERTEGEARRALTSARQRIDSYRSE